MKGAITGSDITVHIASQDEKFGGDSLKNIVNRLTTNGANGIQSEQSARARSIRWQDIAERWLRRSDCLLVRQQLCS